MIIKTRCQFWSGVEWCGLLGLLNRVTGSPENGDVAVAVKLKGHEIDRLNTLLATIIFKRQTTAGAQLYQEYGVRLCARAKRNVFD